MALCRDTGGVATVIGIDMISVLPTLGAPYRIFLEKFFFFFSFFFEMIVWACCGLSEGHRTSVSKVLSPSI